MPNNLIVSYDLDQPNRNYTAVAAAIKTLGTSIKLHKSVWYVKSKYGALDAVNKILSSGAIDSGDRVLVVDATNNDMAWDELLNANKIQELWPN
jgi:hypothetical protein